MSNANLIQVINKGFTGSFLEEVAKRGTRHPNQLSQIINHDLLLEFLVYIAAYQSYASTLVHIHFGTESLAAKYFLVG